MFEKNIEKIKNYILTLLKENYPQENIKDSNLILLNKGKFANATVFRYKGDKIDLTIKDFSGSPWFMRVTFGKLFIKNEGNIMKKLINNPSVAKGVNFLSSCTLAFSFIEGSPLKPLTPGTVSKEFFCKLENSIKQMHEVGVVHLDLRNEGNVILGQDGNPYMIDFQSALGTKYLPHKLKDILEKVDISGVYKIWKNKCSSPLSKENEKFLEDFKEIRKLWKLRGYPIQRLIKKLKAIL